MTDDRLLILIITVVMASLVAAVAIGVMDLHLAVKMVEGVGR